MKVPTTGSTWDSDVCVVVKCFVFTTASDLGVARVQPHVLLLCTNTYSVIMRVLGSS